MQTHEATIHRVDAELTAEVPVTALDPGTPLAGLEHMIAVMWPAKLDGIPDWASITPVATADIAADGEEPAAVLISRWRDTRPRDGTIFDVPIAQPLTRDDTTVTLSRSARSAGQDSPTAEEIWQLPAAEVSGRAQALNLWARGGEVRRCGAPFVDAQPTQPCHCSSRSCSTAADSSPAAWFASTVPPIASPPR